MVRRHEGGMNRVDETTESFERTARMNEHGVSKTGRFGFTSRRAAVLVACAGALWLAGCGEDPGQAALSEASIRLTSLNAGAGTPMPHGTTATGFREVIDSLQSYSGGDGTLAADASVLISSAQRGLGLHAAGAATNLQRSALSRLPEIRATLDTWKMHSAAATAAGAYDPAPEFARIDTDVRARQDEAEVERGTKAGIESEITRLLDGVATRMASAATFRGEAGTLRLKIPGVSATEGLALTEQIRTLTRKADGLELKARELKAQADRKNADLKSSEVTIAKLESQINLFAQSRAAVQTRHAAAQQQAAEARGDAEMAAASIAALVDTASGPVPPALAAVYEAKQGEFDLDDAAQIFGEGPAALTPFMTDAVAPTVEDAARQLETAASTARGASSARRGSAQVAIGQAKQSLGDVRWGEGLGLDAYAQVLEELASASPALPSAAEYASRASAARDESTQAKQAAFDAYQDAKKAYESSGARGDVADRMGEVAERLNDISRVVGAGVVDADAMRALDNDEPDAEIDEGFDEPEDDGTPEATGNPEAELRSAIQAVNDAAAAGDIEHVIDFMRPANDSDIEIITMTGDILRSVDGLRVATSGAFGESFSTWIAANPDPMLSQFESLITGEVMDFDLDTADIRVQGDQAVVLADEPGVPDSTFERVDGVWKQVIDMEGIVADNPEVAEGLDMIWSLMPSFVTMFNELASGVEAGDFDSNATVGTALKAKLMSIVQQQMMGDG
jgi:hypothetical protein